MMQACALNDNNTCAIHSYELCDQWKSVKRSHRQNVHGLHFLAQPMHTNVNDVLYS